MTNKPKIFISNRGIEVITEASTSDARQKARSDMRDAEPHNPYPVNSAQYWAYANEVNNDFNREFLRI